MKAKALPRAYPEWRTDPIVRPEDAAYTFGYHLILYCRDEALAKVPTSATAETRATVEEAVDIALHNVLDMLEGFWPLPSGPSHSVEYSLQVRVRNEAGDVVERLEIAPAMLDLPIGYWKWAEEREFR